MYGLDGKVALITGAGSGIGRAIALRLADEGCAIAAVDVDAAGAEETVAMIGDRSGRRAAATVADVSDFAAVERAAAGAVQALGGIDILVNNAGVIRLASLIETSEEDWRKTFGVNVDGVFHGCKTVGPHMLARGGGAIVNMASWTGKIGNAGFASYSASKAAVIALTQAFAKEVAPTVRVNAVCPGIITETTMRREAEAVSRDLGMPSAEERTATIPLGRLGHPDDVAAVVAYLVSDQSAYMTGQAINVTGGLWMT